MSRIKKSVMPIILVLIIILGSILNGCGSDNLTDNKGTEGWTGGFADLPVNYDKDIFELEFKAADVPVSGKKDKGLMIQGHNRSDDLFMYITKGFTGLKKNIKYSVKLSFDLATNVSAGMIGIGGAPGESVYVKAGIISREPKVESRNDMLEVNFDKGQQATGGSEVELLGNIAKENSKDESYQYKHFEKTFEITTNSKGEAWVVIGTDSGFEGLTKIYYANINVFFDWK